MEPTNAPVAPQKSKKGLVVTIIVIVVIAVAAWLIWGRASAPAVDDAASVPVATTTVTE
jgi:hypothetical protein